MPVAPCRSLCAALAVVCAVLTTQAQPAYASSRRAFVSDTNRARLNHDRHAYHVCRDLTRVAQRWARWMADHHSMQHNPYLTSQVRNWHSVGENVGTGPNEPPIQRMFMGDTYHRENILSRSFTQVGIGTARDERGRLYVDEVFRQPR